MRALILANGVQPSAAHLIALRSQSDLFIAADGAANTLPEGVVPDLVLGDFDSLQPEVRSTLPDYKLCQAGDQEASDLDKAIAHAIQLGATCLIITGALGERIDHTLTAFSLLLKYEPLLDLRIVEDDCSVWVVRGETTVEGSRGDTVSLIAFEQVDGVTTVGLAWPLSDEPLIPGSRGLSNVLVDCSARIGVRRGRVVLCHLRGTHVRLPAASIS